MVRKKTDPFWDYVEQLPGNDRWKCNFCKKEYTGHASRVKAHLGQVKNRGIEICDQVDEEVKDKAVRALGKEAPDKQQHVVEETSQRNDQGIGSENNPFVNPSTDSNRLQDTQPVYNQYSSGEPSHPAEPAASSVPIENNEHHPAMYMSQQADPLFNFDFPLYGEETAMIGTTQDPQWQNTNQPEEASSVPLENNRLNPAMLHALSQEADPRSNPYCQQPSQENAMIVTTQDPQWQNTNQPEPSSVPFENNGHNPTMSHAQSQQDDVLSNSYFQQLSEENAMIGTAQDQNMNQPGANENLVSVCATFDQRLLGLKSKLKRLCSQKEEKKEELYQWSMKLKKQKQEKEEELHQWSKTVKEIKNAYQSMEEEQREGKRPSLEQLNQVEKLINQVEQLGNIDMSDKETSRIAPSSKAPPLLTAKLIGREAEESEIWNSLRSDSILRISVYGMGGVGKTEIMKNIYNKLLNEEAFDNVFWVTMPKYFSVYELQGAIGNAVRLDELSNEKNENIRAAILNRFLTSGKRYVMILDGLWSHFDYNDVGIPLTYKRLKLFITTRSLDVSRMMLCGEKIKISPLSCPNRRDWKKKGDDWELFMHELGVEIELPREVEEIACGIARACEGLPLYIKAIARRMRGVDNLQDWRDMLEKMNDLNERLHELKGPVLDRLKLSYEFLNNHRLQQCFIFCAFFCERGEHVEQEHLEEFLVDVALKDGKSNRKKLLHKARNNLKELEKAGLLSVTFELIQMHKSIIDLALHVATDTNLFMIDFGIGSLYEEFQSRDLIEVSLMRDAANETSKQSSNGFRLPILISRQGFNLTMIPDSLFGVFSELKIIDLSGSSIKELPNSFSDLIKLTALVLRYCRHLNHIPNIEKLAALRKLDLFRCEALKDLPSGLVNLINLEYLDVRDTGIVEMPEGVLMNLKKLQYLGTNLVGARELEGLAKLEFLYCKFSTYEGLAIIFQSLSEIGHGDFDYDISVGRAYVGSHKVGLEEGYKREIIFSKIAERSSKPQKLGCLRCLTIDHFDELRVIFGEVKDERYVTSKDGMSHITFVDLEGIIIENCRELKYLIVPGAVTSYSFPTLQEIHMRNCTRLQRVIPPLANGAFPCLERIDIKECDELEEIIAISSSDTPHPTSTPTLAPALTHFSHLTSLTISCCGKMKRLLSHDTLRYLSNLRVIDVSFCNGMEKVTDTYDERSGNLCTVTRLPNLKTIELWNLPELRSIDAITLANPIESILVVNCPKIKRIPIQMQQLPDGVLTPPSTLKEIKIHENEREWWTSLEWESSEAKNALDQYVCFVSWLIR